MTVALIDGGDRESDTDSPAPVHNCVNNSNKVGDASTGKRAYVLESANQGRSLANSQLSDP